MTKCPYDPHAYYDSWGNRYLVFSDWEYWHVSRHIDYFDLMYYLRKITG